MVLFFARLPVAKLFWLGVRQAARPVARLAMKCAEGNETFRGLCGGTAQWVHRQSIRLARPIGDASAQAQEAHELPVEQAVQNGCALVGEVVVFGLTGSVLVYEYLRAKDAERQQTEKFRGEIVATAADLAQQLRALEARQELQSAELAALRRELAAAAGDRGQRRWWRW
eukprot:gnl/TRDRNA2_/TRDRNA2_199593_c0_seq1.p2 gnl/TRDRNA2_/TRDRNA2_199593_c0~~gnl/TRDRNA2_/TRDRNA2_199593_c0_seq1.p2  ORF type:complete len:170 (-),score=40.44 gnl/TRDRNA2_/TRDRNA2_199593_c0_seq1:76-585(-)